MSIKLMQILKNKWIALILIGLFFGTIFTQLILSGDDFYFNGITLWDARDFILYRNGRYIGNIISILVSGSVMSGYAWIRWLFMTLCMMGLAYMIMKIERFRIPVFALAVLFLIPVDNWREIYNWTPGFVNYLVPMIGILFIIAVCKEIFYNKYVSRYKIIITAIICMVCSFFMETATLYIFLLCLFCILVALKKHENFKKYFLLFCGSLIGCILMFSCVGYRNTIAGNDDAHSVSIVASGIKGFIIQIVEKVYDFSIFTFMLNPIVVTSLTLLFVILILKQFSGLNFRKKIITFLSGMIMIVTMVEAWIFSIQNDFHTSYNLVSGNVFLIAVLGILFWISIIVTCGIVINNRDTVAIICFYMISSLIFFLPMIVLNPDCARSYYFGNVFIGLVMYETVLSLLENEEISIKLKWIIPTSTMICGIGVAIIIFGMMYENNKFYNSRLDYVENEVKTGTNYIEMDILPYPELATNELRSEYGAYFYNKEQFDIEFKLNGIENYDVWK